MFNAVVHVAHLGHEPVDLVFSVSVVVVLLTCENVRLFVEEIVDERLLGVREFGGVVLLIGGFEF